MIDTRRALTWVGAVVALATALTAGIAPAALADPGTITSQPYQGTSFFDPGRSQPD